MAINQSLSGKCLGLSIFARGSRIGKFCSIGAGLKFVFLGKHNYSLVTTYPFVAFFDKWKFNTSFYPFFKDGEIDVEKIPANPIIIENDVWTCNNVLIKQGVTVGSGAVIAMESVVVEDVPPYAVVGGTPQKSLSTDSNLSKYDSCLK